ncbi:MAG: VWA domain-containing protein [Lachnospiraceae bacterium]|nr:VWA domain-containing protein [Lachnospiraceae bacterium]
MTQMIIFAALVLLCAGLMAASLWKKWCWKPFYGIVAAAALLCMAGAAASWLYGAGIPVSGEKKELQENLYLSARLLQEGDTMGAVAAAGEAAQAEPENPDARFLQTLGLNQSGSYSLSSQIAEGGAAGEEDSALAGADTGSGTKWGQMLEQNPALQGMKENLDRVLSKFGKKSGRTGGASNPESGEGASDLADAPEDGELEPRLIEVQEKNELEEKLEKERALELAEEVLDRISADDEEKERWEMRLRLRYGSKSEQRADDLEYGSSNSMKKAGIRRASLDGSYGDAYQMAKELAEQGDMEAKILLSEMFVNNYEPYDYGKTDEEMDDLLNQVTRLQVELEKLEAVMGGDGSSSGGAEAETSEPENASEEKLTYERKLTEYQMAVRNLDKAPVLRAVNYLKENKPDWQNEIGYYLQLAKLYYLADMEDEAASQLDRIFYENRMNRSQWLGVECMMVRDAFLAALKGDKDAGFEEKYECLFDSLNQGIVIQNAGLESGFQAYLNAYFLDLYTGIRIGKLKAAKFPQITAEISYAGEDELTAGNLAVIDTDSAVTDFTLTKKEGGGLSICFVLDRSGSMKGDRMSAAKQAISQFISNVDEGIQLGLVTFENDASVDLALTDSKSSVISRVNEAVAYGGTNIAAGLEAGGQVLKNAPGRKVVILLSDGQDGNADKMDRVLEDLSIQSIPVYSIGLTGSDTAYMQNIADMTEGTFVLADNPTDLYKIYGIIRQYIMNTYELVYQVPEPAEETDRELRVELKERPSFDTRDYYIGLRERQEQKNKKRPEANYYRQTGGSYRGE